MAEYLHECANPDCPERNFWLEYSVKVDPPTVCPHCGTEGVKRLISGLPKVGVELYGDELKRKIKEDVVKLKHKVRTDENTLANVVGESKYESNVKAFGG